MERCATESFTNATAVAVRLVVERRMDFRSAHRLVGEAVTRAIARGDTSLNDLAGPGGADALDLPLEGLDPASCVRRNRYGGGPAPDNVRRLVAALRESAARRRRDLIHQARTWRGARRGLSRAVDSFVSEGALA